MVQVVVVVVVVGGVAEQCACQKWRLMVVSSLRSAELTMPVDTGTTAKLPLLSFTCHRVVWHFKAADRWVICM